MHVIVRIQWLAENVVFPAGGARQRMHIRAARRKRMPVFGKNGATTKTYGVEPDSATGFGDGGEKKDACRGERDRAVGGI
jgi:phosphatidylcholine synthase